MSLNLSSRKIPVIAAILAAGVLFAGSAQASRVNWSVSVGVPAVTTVVSSGGYYQAAPVYYPPPPVYYEPRPVVTYRPAPVVVEGPWCPPATTDGAPAGMTTAVTWMAAAGEALMRR